jgi:LysM repeat protein
MNKEVKMTIAILLCFVIGIIYLEFSNHEPDLTNVEPIATVKIVEPPPQKTNPKTVATKSTEQNQQPPNVLLKKTPPKKEIKQDIKTQPLKQSIAQVIKKKETIAEPSSSRLEELSKINPLENIPQYYVVKKGDSASGISRSTLGSVHFLKALMEANPELQPHRLYPGTRLVMPAKKSLISVATDYNEDHASKGSYFVQKGDTLYNIALRECGSVKKVKEIIELNPKLDPGRLMVGQRLRLPTEK